MKRNNKRIWIFSSIMFGIFALAIGFSIFGFSSTIGEIRNEIISRTPTAILASKGVKDKSDIVLPVSYFDQRADECVNMYNLDSKFAERQFEWVECGYNNHRLEEGMVEAKLGEDYLPVGVGGNLMSNRGMKDMERWFHVVEGKSENYLGNIRMKYEANGAKFSFFEKEFYPLDDVEFSNGDFVNDKHNHLFTMNFAVPFTILGGGEESFEIVADDDTFVYVGNDLVIDMGGIHDATTGRFYISENGEVVAQVSDGEPIYAGISFKVGDESIVRIFHADRDSSSSTFGVSFNGMSLTVMNSELADNGVQIAYDPTNPSYVGPLGASSIVKPSGLRGQIIMATIQGMLVIVSVVLIIFLIHFVVKQKVFNNK